MKLPPCVAPQSKIVQSSFVLFLSFLDGRRPKRTRTVVFPRGTLTLLCLSLCHNQQKMTYELDAKARPMMASLITHVHKIVHTSTKYALLQLYELVAFRNTKPDETPDNFVSTTKEAGSSDNNAIKHREASKMMATIRLFVACLLLADQVHRSSAWTTSSTSNNGMIIAWPPPQTTTPLVAITRQGPILPRRRQANTWARLAQEQATTVEDDASSSSTTTTTAATTSTKDDDDNAFLTMDESQALEELHGKATVEASHSKDDDATAAAFSRVVEEGLSTLSPGLIMKLKQGWHQNNDADIQNEETLKTRFEAVADVLHELSLRRLNLAKKTLEHLMNAGEMKKLDALIGKAAREGNLDVAFFQVLQINLQDAAVSEAVPKSTNKNKDHGEDVGASRLQILQHVYTRCQEEVEKIIAPGIALLNKLLRTEQSSIRQNQLQHYLCPQPSTIKSPDGKEITLGSNSNKTLVEHNDFVDALSNAVQQIRIVELAGATPREVAAGMVESCRQVAKEARSVMADYYGSNSPQILAFEEALQPVFRPTSTESPYVTGVEQDASDDDDGIEK